jgi:hypothetical protein
MALEEWLAVVLALQERDSSKRVVSRVRAGMCSDRETYRTVRRQATSEDTPASIKTSLPNPEPVPALPGSLCSAIVEMVCEVGMAMRIAATAAVVSCVLCSYCIFPDCYSCALPVKFPALRAQIFGGGGCYSGAEDKTALRSRQLDSWLFCSTLEQWRELCRVRDRHPSASHATPQPLFFSVM